MKINRYWCETAKGEPPLTMSVIRLKKNKQITLESELTEMYTDPD